MGWIRGERVEVGEFAREDAETTEPPIDVGFAVVFDAPRSFTGEDVVEFHTHGSLAVQRAVMDALGELDCFRVAEAGEFSRRAFRNGKMDLTQAEGLADLLDAETEAQRKQAMMLSRNAAQRVTYERWRRELLTCAAHCRYEALDFGEEEDISTDVVARDVLARVEALRETLQRHLDAPARGELIRRGVRVALVGAPNVGKSSMLNALAGRQAAIVSPHAGTTRDVLEVSLELDGYKVIVSDTAGLRETEDDVEKLGIERALERVADADVVVASRRLERRLRRPSHRRQSRPQDRHHGLEQNRRPGRFPNAMSRRDGERTHRRRLRDGARHRCLTGDGVDAFVTALTRVVARKCAVDTVGPHHPTMTPTRWPSRDRDTASISRGASHGRSPPRSPTASRSSSAPRN